MRARRLFSILGALVLSIALVGCGSAVDVEKLTGELVGTWEFESGTFGGRTFGEEERDQLRALGVNVTIDLDSNGDMLLDAGGDQTKGTWKIKDETTIELDDGSDSVDVAYEDDRLTLTDGDEHMTFVKVDDDPDCDRDPSENAGLLGAEEQEEGKGDDAKGKGDDSDATDLQSMVDTIMSPEADAANAAYVAGVTVTSPMDLSVLSNGHFDIRCVGVGEDFEGDTGYLLEVTNKTDEDLVLTVLEASIDGEDAYDPAFFTLHVTPNGTAKGFFYFEHESFVVDETTHFTGEIGVLDAKAEPFDVLNFSIN